MCNLQCSQSHQQERLLTPNVNYLHGPLHSLCLYCWWMSRHCMPWLPLGVPDLAFFMSGCQLVYQSLYWCNWPFCCCFKYAFLVYVALNRHSLPPTLSVKVWAPLDFPCMHLPTYTEIPLLTQQRCDTVCPSFWVFWWGSCVGFDWGFSMPLCLLCSDITLSPLLATSCTPLTRDWKDILSLQDVSLAKLRQEELSGAKTARCYLLTWCNIGSPKSVSYIM